MLKTSLLLREITRKGRVGYVSILDALADLVSAGRLEAGEQLPTQRALAKELGIAVATVTRAYSEAQRCGFIASKHGKGSYVSHIALTDPNVATTSGAEDVIDLSISRPPVEGSSRYFRETLRILSSWPGVEDLLGASPANGALGYRRIAARWISKRGFEVSPSQIVACYGVQNALSVVFGALSRPGGIVATEALNFPGIKLIADANQLSLVGIPVDKQGLRVDLLEKLCREHSVQFVLCSPTAHNPTTATLSEERRHQLVRLAEIHNFLIVENDILGLMPKLNLPSLFSLAPRKTIYITGTSKVLAAGLRLGFLVAPTSLLHPLMGGVRSTIWMPPPLMLAIFSHWVEQGIAELILEWHRKEIATRLEIVDKVLGLDGLVVDVSSYHVWIPLPSGCDLSGFADRAFENGVAISPSDTFTLSPDQMAPRAVRISLGFPNDQVRLRRGLERLSGLLGDCATPVLQ